MGGAEGTKLDMEFTDMERVIIQKYKFIISFLFFCWILISFVFLTKNNYFITKNPTQKQKETKQTNTSVRLIIYFSENRRNSGVG